MKTFVLVAFAVVVGLACARPDEKYTTKYDNVDLDEILKSDRLLKNYFNCLMERGTCTPDGEELRSKLILYFAYFIHKNSSFMLKNNHFH
jgi:hypothetical protein